VVVEEERSHGKYLHKAKFLFAFSVFEASVIVEGVSVDSRAAKSSASISVVQSGKVNAE
jgi:hypothetical protein